MPNSTNSTDRHWYVARVRSCQEKKAAEGLASRGTEYYLPVRREVRRWSDRRKVVDALVLPRFIFLHCTNQERLEALAAEPRIIGFLSSEGVPSVVRDVEMEAFRRMVEQGGGVSVTRQPLAPGDRVRVLDGPLAGLECELVSVGSGRCLAVRLGLLGTATMDLDIQTVEKI